MRVSREYALAELKSARDAIVGWIEELEDPSVYGEVGGVVRAYPGGVPTGLSVESVEGIPVDQLRAELVALAGKLEALASG